MKYSKNVTRLYLLSLAENVANAMLNEDGDYITPFNVHLFCSFIGAAQLFDMKHEDIFRLSPRDKLVYFGNDLHKVDLAEFFRGDSMWAAFKSELQSSDSEWNTKNYTGIFKFINSVKLEKIQIPKKPLSTTKPEEIISFWEDMRSLIPDEFTRILIGEHLNSILMFLDRKQEYPKSMLTCCICNSFGYIANEFKDFTIYFSDVDYIKDFVGAHNKFINFLKDNYDCYFLDANVPKQSTLELKKLFGAGDKYPKLDNEVTLESPIGDDLAKDIKKYVELGGNPAKLIQYINSIS